PLRPALADPAQRRLRPLPQRGLPRSPREAVLRRRSAAPLRLRGGRDARPDPQPAPRDARPQRRRDAALRDRAGLGLGELRVALGARSLGPGRRAGPGVLDARRPPALLADRRGL